MTTMEVAVMIRVATVADMEMIMVKEVDVADMLATMKFLLDHSKDWLVIVMQNLDQNKLKVVILKSQWVMDQRQELMAIMMLQLDQNQRIHNHNHLHQKTIPKDLVEM